MQKTDNTPIWVYLAFSSIATRKGALLLILVSVIFTLYCIPWPQFFTKHDSVMKLFMIKDWSWFVIMAPTTIWYWISLKWVDKYSKWDVREHK